MHDLSCVLVVTGVWCFLRDLCSAGGDPCSHPDWGGGCQHVQQRPTGLPSNVSEGELAGESIVGIQSVIMCLQQSWASSLL